MRYSYCVEYSYNQWRMAKDYEGSLETTVVCDYCEGVRIIEEDELFVLGIYEPICTCIFIWT